MLNALYEHGLRHGRGAYIWANGNAKYEGEYYRGKRNGAGRMYYPDGSMYEGNWNDNQRNGAGMYRYKNKDVYNGNWQNDARHGQGTYQYNSKAQKGTVFTGNWMNGKADGAGELVHGNSHRYQGSWQDDLIAGPGKYIFSFGAEQHGEYIPVEQDVEGIEDADEAINGNTISRWRAHKITPITVDAAQILDK